MAHAEINEEELSRRTTAKLAAFNDAVRITLLQNGILPGNDLGIANITIACLVNMVCAQQAVIDLLFERMAEVDDSIEQARTLLGADKVDELIARLRGQG